MWGEQAFCRVVGVEKGPAGLAFVGIWNYKTEDLVGTQNTDNEVCIQSKIKKVSGKNQSWRQGSCWVSIWELLRISWQGAHPLRKIRCWVLGKSVWSGDGESREASVLLCECRFVTNVWN